MELSPGNEKNPHYLFHGTDSEGWMLLMCGELARKNNWGKAWSRGAHKQHHCSHFLLQEQGSVPAPSENLFMENISMRQCTDPVSWDASGWRIWGSATACVYLEGKRKTLSGEKAAEHSWEHLSTAPCPESCRISLRASKDLGKLNTQTGGWWEIQQSMSPDSADRHNCSGFKYIYLLFKNIKNSKEIFKSKVTDPLM